MNRICWYFVGILSRALEAEEREAVRGDLVESGQLGAHALRDVVGLVIRRGVALHVSPWRDWRPWLALLGLVAPCGWLLMVQSRTLGRGYAEFFWILRNYADLDPDVLLQTGLTPGNEFQGVFNHSLLMICWCWSSGFVLGSISRRSLWFNGLLFSAILLIPAVTAPQQPYPYEVRGAIPLAFYTMVFPLIQQAILTVLPALWGMHLSRPPDRSARIQAVLWITSLVTAFGASDFLWWGNRYGWQMQLLLLTTYWPIGYAIATVNWERLRLRRS